MRGWLAALALLAASPAAAENPIVPGWYADPEIRIFDGQYWIYPTFSAPTDEVRPPLSFTPEQAAQRANPAIWAPFLGHTFLDAFSSPDLVHWTRHDRVLSVETVSWAAYAVWAPSAIERNGRYYLFFGANDIKTDQQPGGIGLAVADRPEGPFRDALGHPLIGAILNGAQPIDQMVFVDDDGRTYLFYGGWGHCNVVRLSDDLTQVIPFDDGETFKETTPEGYVEGPFMLKRRGLYYLMWSEGDWTTSEYRVAYAVSTSPFGPFKREGLILQQNDTIARGAGHHSVVNIPGTDDWVIAYHRRPLNETDGNHREVALDRLVFRKDGHIEPVVMTNEGVAARPLD
ncbi:MAG: arabinan endo-1,5-alpha-L-arabinosidase [Brevundimonas sp.]|nr:MAG: arabinan endo-1,5-alpha-L-arabinosidase [Brevundimonas sp.]